MENGCLLSTWTFPAVETLTLLEYPLPFQDTDSSLLPAKSLKIVSSVWTLQPGNLWVTSTEDS